MNGDHKRGEPIFEYSFAAACRFLPPEEINEVREFGNGNINDTFLVTPRGRDAKRFVLQRVNTGVFRMPDLIMRNVGIVSAHVLKRLQQEPPAEGRRWEVPHILTARSGLDHWIDPEGSFWRAMSLVESACSHETVEDAGHAREVGWALGMFQSLISDLAVERLADTLEGFHIAPLYLAHYDQASALKCAGNSPEMDYAARFVSDRRPGVEILEDARAGGKLRLRPTHGDPKVNNIMMDVQTRQAVGMIDLDTVKPGLVHYDIGDCLRSACNTLGEETECWEAVRFETDLCRSILQGYLPLAKAFFTDNDYEYLFDAIRLIPFELGLRFFTDHLAGDIYFKTRYGGHNLLRALVQFKLTESIESQERAIRAFIREMR